MTRHPGPPRAADTRAVIDSIARRRALGRLGLIAGASYMAPTLLALTGTQAQETGPNSDRSNPNWNKPTKPSKPPGPKKKKS